MSDPVARSFKAGVGRWPVWIRRASLDRERSGRMLRAPSRIPIWSSNGQVYVATTDRIVSAFGYAQDRHP